MAKRAQKSPAAQGSVGKKTTARTRAQTPADPVQPSASSAASTQPPPSQANSARPKQASARMKGAAPKAAASKPRPAPQPSDAYDDDDLDTSVNTASGPAGPSRGTTGAAMGGGPQRGENENYLEFLARVFQDMSAGSWNPQQFDSMTQGMNLVLGSGPAFAALESMMANTTAQSAVLMNAVQTQRQLDQVGLCCTSACVQQLLNMNTNRDSD